MLFKQKQSLSEFCDLNSTRKVLLWLDLPLRPSACLRVCFNVPCYLTPADRCCARITNFVSHLCSTQLFGDVCYHCNRVIEGDGEQKNIINTIKLIHLNEKKTLSVTGSNHCVIVCVCSPDVNQTYFQAIFFLFLLVVSALNKAWCVNCFACSTCNSKLTLKWVTCSSRQWRSTRTFSPTSHSHFTFQSAKSLLLHAIFLFTACPVMLFPALFFILPLLHFYFLPPDQLLIPLFLPSSPSTLCLRFSSSRNLYPQTPNLGINLWRWI